MASRVDLQPTNRAPVVLFAHRGEAVVFWASLGGLVLLTLITVFQLAGGGSADRAYRELDRRQLSLIARVDSLDRSNEAYQQQLARLRNQLVLRQAKIDSLLDLGMPTSTPTLRQEGRGPANIATEPDSATAPQNDFERLFKVRKGG